MTGRPVVSTEGTGTGFDSSRTIDVKLGPLPEEGTTGPKEQPYLRTVQCKEWWMHDLRV